MVGSLFVFTAAVAMVQPSSPEPMIAYPHPLITEILYVVPTGSGGDANKDGMRSATGDEFIEIVNPHDRPIELKGYVLEDRGLGRGQWRFEFPALQLAPGEVAVVFNGYECAWKGPVGDSDLAPAGRNDAFNNAWVFTSRAASTHTAWSNTGDHVLLRGPGGAALHLISWGEAGREAPPAATIVEQLKNVTGASAYRKSVAAPLEAHPAVEGVRFSPGVFPVLTK